MKITNKNLSMLFVALYPILPAYFLIGGFGVSNLVPVALFGLYIVLYQKNSLYFNYTLRGTKDYISIVCVIALWLLCRSISMLANSLYNDTILLVIKTVLVYIALKKMISTKEIFLDCIEAVVFTAGIACVFGIVEEITHFNIFSLTNTSCELNYNPLRFGILRIISFSSHTIVYGLYLMIVMSLCVYILQFQKKGSMKRWIIIFTYILMWLNLILTLSRSAILAAIACQFVILYLSGFKRMIKRVLVLLFSGITIGIVLSLISDSIATMLSYFWYMLLAVFDDSYSAIISSAFGNDNLSATGNRIDLYNWVFEKMNNNWIFGNGATEFSYAIQKSNGVDHWTTYKTSIEVQYLYVLYHYGLLGLIPEVISYICLLCKSLKGHLQKIKFEPVVSFNTICFATFLCYFIVMFAVNQSSDRGIFYTFTMLFLIYNFNNFFSLTKVKSNG